MKKKYFLIRLCFLFSLVAGLILTTPNSHAKADSSGGWVYTVTTTADEISDGECVIDCTLREAIALADDGDTVSITVTGTITMDNLLSGYQISKSITINGPGSSNLIIDANFNHRIFYISQSAVDGVSMSGLTLTGGNTSLEGGVQYGGAIASYAPLTLNDMHIDHNTAGTSDGGGIFMSGAFSPTMPTLTIEHSVLTNNSGVLGGNLYITSADLDMSYTTVSAGSASYGGGIYIDSFGSTSPDLSIAASRITGNTATLGAGGISVREKTRLFISYSSIDQNEAAAFGGGIDYYSDETTSLLSLFSSTIGENRLTADGTPGTPDSNSGAGIYMRGNVSIINSTIAYNDGDGGNGAGTNSFGGGIYSVSLVGTTQTLYNSIIANNLADNGPAIEGNIVTSGGYNLVEEGATGFTSFVNNDIVGSDPLLDPLQVNLLGTADYPLAVGSPAMNTIPTSNIYCVPPFVIAIDQRFVQRPQNSFCDMGAYEVDNTAPFTTAITRRDANPTSAPLVYFQPAFSEYIIGLDISDFSLVTTGSISGASIVDVNEVGEVVVDTGTGNGTIKVIVSNTASISDYAGLSMVGLPFTVGETYDIDKTAPIVTSSVRTNSNPTNLTSVDFTVTFSEPVTGVDLSDFSLTTSSVSSPAVSGLSGTGSVYTVTVNTGSGNGTIRLNVLNDNSIIDIASNPLSAGLTGGETYTILKSATFSDVPLTYWASSYIERLFNAGITGGCGTGIYCPDNSVTRAQMAIFLLKGIHGSSYTPPAVGANTGFGDVAVEYWAAAWIKQLAAEGITGGCGGGNYCPDNVVTRAQMAVFLLKAKNGSSYSPPAVGVSTGFNDVATDAFAAAFIKQLVADGITAGCGNSNYCPNDSVTRAQMAVFLVRAFNLP